MTKENLLQQIAESAYNVGFGAKKHFATFDMIEKLPGIISFASIAIGILSLYIEFFTLKNISATLVIFGIVGIYISSYNDTKKDYSEAGSEITKHFNSLKELYYEVKAKLDDDQFDEAKEKLKTIEDQFYSKSISKQILFSDWYAHYKFFWQWRKHINWVEKQLNLTLWKDKLPLSFLFVIVVISMLMFYFLTNNFCCIELVQVLSDSK
ncbi:SLATT domain-containing protein [Sulfurimonas sp.]|uniref:SLATT domain-containing protein n=1 Tax=Sulfurimonas sp. TaxID=2022749 RepID=UPI0025EAE4F5|nr:SLATT domain-containing protein [Sulfurimonas sp.]MCK9454753.1 SLATT domain-containing protein [Sulfurimonas sp.]